MLDKLVIIFTKWRITQVKITEVSQDQLPRIIREGFQIVFIWEL